MIFGQASKGAIPVVMSRFCAILAFGLFAGVAQVSAQEVSQDTSIPLIVPSMQAAPVEEKASEILPPAVSPSTNIFLDPLPDEALAEPADTEGPKPMRAGIGRAVAATADSIRLGQLFDWQVQPDGSRSAAIRLISPDSKGVRLVLDVESMDPRTRLVFRADSGEAQLIDGFAVLDSLFKDRQHPDHELSGVRYVGPYMAGEAVTFEVHLPAAVDTDSLRFSIPMLSHLVVTPHSEFLTPKIGESGSCNNDVSCSPDWAQVSSGVARMLFTDVLTGSSFVCTGSLLNDTASSGTPYFLTANHCIDRQSRASTLQTFWNYRSSSCNSDLLAGNSATRSGSTLLYTQSNTDTTLLHLSQTPPATASYLGWTTQLPSTGTAIRSLHNPHGDLQKISAGSVSGLSICRSFCVSAPASTATYLRVSWSSGVVEPGSSGSGLFATFGGSKFLVGQLLGGTSSCEDPTGNDYYGRFDVAYRDGMSQWLNASVPPPTPDPVPPPVEPVMPDRTGVFRFYNTATGAHFYTASAAERDTVIDRYPVFAYEGVAFHAYPETAASLSPVYRFYNNRTGAHFFTISAAERDLVIQRYPDFIYEGVAWYAAQTAVSGSTPLYRFYNNRTGVHFYTTSSAERDYVIANFPVFIYEGVGYHVWNTQ